MSFDRQQFIATMAERRQKRSGEMLPQLRMMQAQASVMERLLTSFDHWNKYLSYLQGLVDRAKQSRDAAMAKQNDPAIWDGATMSRLKAEVAEASAMIRAWDIAMQLPRALIEDGTKADALILEFDKKNETAAEPQP